jgi:hypothetical protein
LSFFGDGDVRSNGNFGAGLTTGWVHLDDGAFDLAVIEVHPGVLEGIPDALLKVVPIAASRIGWKQIELNFKQALKRLTDPPREPPRAVGACGPAPLSRSFGERDHLCGTLDPRG